MKRNDTFLTKNFSSEELINSSPESISGKFAAKEAIIKAFGDIQKLKLSEIKIINSSSGKPTFELINDKMNIISKDLSITHTEDNAIASVVILTNEL
jgi:holo-[acyl-carrier protein] synthase